MTKKFIPLKEIKIFDWQSQVWILLGLGVIAIIVSIIYNWKDLEGTTLLWNLGICGIIGAVAWWVWTMYVIRQLLNQKLNESITIVELVNQISILKKEIKKNLNRNKDS